MSLAAGCGYPGGQNSGRDTIVQGGKEITVLDNPEKLSYEETAATPLVRIDGIRGWDWLGGDLLVASKPNPEAAPVEIEGTPQLPINLYAYHASTGEETALAPHPAENQGYALANPGHSRVFYKTFDYQSNTGTGYVLDLRTRKSVRITQKDELELTNGVWMDDETIVYSSMEGKVFAVSADGSKKKALFDPKAKRVANLAIAGSRVFYTTESGLLFAVDLKTEERALLWKNAVWASPSPDGLKVAVVNRIKSGSMELSIVDSASGSRVAIAQDTQIFGIGWSPEGKRLVYAGISPSGTARGVYVADTVSGQSTPLPLDVKYIADAPQWNLSGDRVMVTAVLPAKEGGQALSVTYLVATK